MPEAGIGSGGVLIIEANTSLSGGSMVAATALGGLSEEATVKVLRRRSREVVLEPQDEAPFDDAPLVLPKLLSDTLYMFDSNKIGGQ